MTEPIFTKIVSAAENVHELAAEETSKLVPKTGRVVDLGAGEGVTLNLLKKNGYQNLLGVDLVNNFRLDDVKYLSADLNLALPLEANSFDGVISSEVIEHIENPWHLTREIFRILKPGGIAVITTPNANSLISRIGFLRKGTFRMFEEEHYRDWGHITPLTWYFLTKMFERAGLKIVKHQYNNNVKFVGTKMQVKFQQIFHFLFGKFLRGELGGDINIITLKKPE